MDAISKVVNQVRELGSTDGAEQDQYALLINQDSNTASLINKESSAAPDVKNILQPSNGYQVLTEQATNISQDSKVTIVTGNKIGVEEDSIFNVMSEFLKKSTEKTISIIDEYGSADLATGLVGFGDKVSTIPFTNISISKELRKLLEVSSPNKKDLAYGTGETVGALVQGLMQFSKTAVVAGCYVVSSNTRIVLT